MELIETCSLMEDLSGISFTVLHERKQYTNFCHRHHFHRIQRFFSMPFFYNTINNDLLENTIYHTEDRLMIHTTVIRLNDAVLVVGPYITTDLTETNVTMLFEREKIDNVNARDYRAYRSNFILVRQEEITNSCRYMLSHCGYDVAGIQTVELNSSQSSNESWNYTVRNFETLVNERYRVEEEMMDQIATGNTEGAISSYRYLHNNVKFMANIGGTLESSWVSSGITRTTVRVAAMKAGLPPVLIDTISGESGRRIMRCHSREEMYRENERMITSFTRAINRFRINKYSPLVLNSIYYIETNYSQDISLDELAARNGTSLSTLIRNFKKETGKTPGNYLLEYRISMARRMLKASQYTITDIAERVGIPDSNYFTKCFKKLTDMTPTEYRYGYIGQDTE